MALVGVGAHRQAGLPQVTGTSTGVKIEDGTMCGPVPPTTGWEATTLRDAVNVDMDEMSDSV